MVLHQTYSTSFGQVKSVQQKPGLQNYKVQTQLVSGFF
jgi:hypothetical protein